MTLLRLCLVTGLVLGCITTSAKTTSATKTLTLEDAVLLAVRKNPEVRSARLQRVIDEYSLLVARNEFWPQYSFNARGEVVEGRDPYGSAEPNVKLKTAIGTEIDLGVRASHVDGDDTSDVTLSVRQPLLRGSGPSVTLAPLKNALDNDQINKLELKNTIESTITKVIKAYYKIVEDYNKLDVDKLALSDSLRTLKVTKMRIKTGKLAPTDVTQQEAQVSDLRFAITQDKNAISRDYQDFLILLGLNPKAKFNIVRKIPEQKIVVPDINKSIDIAMNKNIGYVKELIGYREKKRSVVVAKNDQLWKLDLVGSMNKDLTGHLHLHNLDDKVVYNEKRVGLELEIPINDLSRKQKLVDAKVGLKKYQIALDNASRKLKTEVVNIVRDLQAQKHQIESAQRSVKFSEESLRIAERKFKFGRTTMFEITSLRKDLTQRKNALIQQRIAYLNSLAVYQQTLGITLDQWHLKLNDQMRRGL